MIVTLFRFILPLFLLAPIPHEYYVSIFDLNYNQEVKTLEITGKVFLNDLESALMNSSNNLMLLGTVDEDPEADARIETYLRKKLTLISGGKPLTLRFVGKEIENDLIYLYAEVEELETFKDLEINCHFLLDAFPAQMNIIHVKSGDKQESVLLRREKTVEKVDL